MLPNLMVFEQCMPFRKLLAHSDYKSLLHELMIYVYLNPCNENLNNIDKKDRFTCISSVTKWLHSTHSLI